MGTTDDVSNSGELSRLSPKLLVSGDRKLLKVELRQGETSLISWKKLMKEASKGIVSSSSAAAAHEPPPNANPNLESRLAPGQPAEGEVAAQPHPNRLNAVLEKIERLYMGKDSSDGEELDGAPDDDEYDSEDSFIDDAELDEYFEVDNSAMKHDGYFVNRGKLERIEPSTTLNQKPKKRKRKESAKPCCDFVDVSRKQSKVAKTAGGQDQSAASGPSSEKKFNDSKPVQDSFPLSEARNGNDSVLLEIVKHSDKANHQPRNATSPKSKGAGSSATLNPKCSNKGAHQQSNSLPGKSRPNVSAKSTEVRHKENNGMHDLDNTSKKSGSNVRRKTSTLEKAIRELEKVVAESRPPAATENQDVDTSQAVKRRLPGDIKLKLAKVARNAPAKEGNVSGELINRLMGIVGHLIQVRSLKRNLKIMIDSGDSANRENDTRFQRIKNEVIEILKTQVPMMESQATNQEAGTSDDFQDVGSVEKPPLKKFFMNAVLEDKLCDLYDIFIDGLDEDSGPQCRKLYASLAELWPNKSMDNHEIKRAICRAKERRRAFHANLGKEMDQAKMTKKKQKLCVPNSEADKASATGDKTSVVPSAATTSLVNNQPTVEPSRDKSKKQHEKLKGAASSSNPSTEAKTVKRKTDAGLEESHLPAEKHLVLALRQHTHPPQIKTEAPPDPNLPS